MHRIIPLFLVLSVGCGRAGFTGDDASDSSLLDGIGNGWVELDGGLEDAALSSDGSAPEASDTAALEDAADTSDASDAEPDASVEDASVELPKELFIGEWDLLKTGSGCETFFPLDPPESQRGLIIDADYRLNVAMSPVSGEPSFEGDVLVYTAGYAYRFWLTDEDSLEGEGHREAVLSASGDVLWAEACDTFSATRIK